MSEQKQIFQSYKGFIVHFGHQIDHQLKDHFFHLLEEHELKYYLLHNHEFDQTIGSIIQKLEDKYQTENFVEEHDKIGDTDIPENILFFSGFSREEVEEYLAILRDPKYPRFVLKAAATRNNQEFTFAKLINELRQDRTVISHVIKLRTLLTKASEKLKHEDNQEVKNQLASAELLFADIENQFDIKAFQENIAYFTEYLKES